MEKHGREVVCPIHKEIENKAFHSKTLSKLLCGEMALFATYS